MAPRLRTPDSEVAESTVRVDHRPPVRDLSYIPEDLADYFESIGQRVTLASNMDQEIAKLSINSRFPVSVDDIPADIRGEGNRNLLRFGMRVGPEGFIKKGDCILFSQPHDARDAELAEGRERWLAQDSEDFVDGQVDSINDLFLMDPNAARMKKSGVSVHEAGTLSSHAGGGRRG